MTKTIQEHNDDNQKYCTVGSKMYGQLKNGEIF